MRLVYFSQDYTTHDWRYLNKLAQLIEEVYYLRLAKKKAVLETRPLPDKVKLVEWPGGKKEIKSWRELLQLLPALKNILSTIQPDIVHCGPVQTCGLLMALSGYHPWLLMSWGSDLLRDSERNWFWKKITQYTLKRANAIMVDTLAGRKKVLDLVKNYPAEKILIFPWGVDLSIFKPADFSPIRAKLNWQDKLVIISTRSWEPIYGVDIILKAFGQTAKKITTARLLLLGTGSLASEIQRIIQEQHLKDFVHIAGQVTQTDLVNYYNASDIYAGASYSDGTSVSLLEAMACGLPVIVSNIPTNREWVTDGENGYLFGPGNAEELAGILSKISADVSLLKEMGRKNIRIVKERADWNKNFQLLIEIYKRIETQKI